jgi:hypothetical protein
MTDHGARDGTRRGTTRRLLQADAGRPGRQACGNHRAAQWTHDWGGGLGQVLADTTGAQ